MMKFRTEHTHGIGKNRIERSSTASRIVYMIVGRKPKEHCSEISLREPQLAEMFLPQSKKRPKKKATIQPDVMPIKTQLSMLKVLPMKMRR